MTKDELLRLALELPVEDRLDLADTLWESPSLSEDFALTPELRDLLEARLREAEANPEKGLTWEEVVASIRGKSGPPR